MINKALLILLTVSIVSFIKPKENKPPEKEYTVKGTIQEFQILLSHPDDVAKSIRDKVVAKFVAQLNQQITDTIPKHK